MSLVLQPRFCLPACTALSQVLYSAVLCHWPSFLACPYRLPTWLQLPSPSCHSHSAVCKNHRFHCNCNRSLCIFPHIMEGSWVACALFPVGISCPCDQRSLYLILSLQVNSPSLVTSLPSGAAALLPSWRLTTHSFLNHYRLSLILLKLFVISQILPGEWSIVMSMFIVGWM